MKIRFLKHQATLMQADSSEVSELRIDFGRKRQVCASALQICGPI